MPKWRMSVAKCNGCHREFLPDADSDVLCTACGGNGEVYPYEDVVPSIKSMTKAEFDKWFAPIEQHIEMELRKK